eukprot:gene34661-42751_t
MGWRSLTEFQLNGFDIQPSQLDLSPSTAALRGYFSLGETLKLDFNAVILSVKKVDDSSYDIFEAYPTDVCFNASDAYHSATYAMLSCDNSDATEHILEVTTYPFSP